MNHYAYDVLIVLFSINVILCVAYTQAANTITGDNSKQKADSTITKKMYDIVLDEKSDSQALHAVLSTKKAQVNDREGAPLTLALLKFFHTPNPENDLDKIICLLKHTTLFTAINKHCLYRFSSKYKKPVGPVDCGYTILHQIAEMKYENNNPRRHVGLVDAHYDFRLMNAFLIHESRVNEQDSHGRTPLMLAISSNSLGMVQSLLESGADISKKDKTGRDVFSYARDCSFSSVGFPNLIEHDPKVGSLLQNHKNELTRRAVIKQVYDDPAATLIAEYSSL